MRSWTHFSRISSALYEKPLTKFSHGRSLFTIFGTPHLFLMRFDLDNMERRLPLLIPWNQTICYFAMHTGSNQRLTSPGAIKLTRMGARSTAKARVAASKAPAPPATNVQSFRGFTITDPTTRECTIHHYIWWKHLTCREYDWTSRFDLCALCSLQSSPITNIQPV